MKFIKSQNLDYNYLSNLRKFSAAWRVLCIDNSALVISFLYSVFIKSNQRAIRYGEIITKLDDYLFYLRSNYGENLYPRMAREYIEDWLHPDNAFLRSYYPPSSDEPELDITPATEKAIAFIQGLEQSQFIGTESRLLQLFELVRGLVNHTEADPEIRLNELQQKKQAIEMEIAKITAGNIDIYDKRQVKERYMQINDTARQLIGDFRQVEYNFRLLDREMREKITLSEKSKGKLLDEMFVEQDAIKDSDQGRSFSAFWEYLMSPTRQDELRLMIKKIITLPEINEDALNGLLTNMDRHLLEVGEKVYRSYNLIAEQLRKFLDSQTFLENKRIMDIIRGIEKTAIELKDNIPYKDGFVALADTKPEINLFMSRPLFNPPKNPLIESASLQLGTTAIELDILYAQNQVDEAQLLLQIQKLLQHRSQVSLGEVVEKYPLNHGLAEIVTYLHLASKSDKAYIDDSTRYCLNWTNDEISKQIDLPNIIFTR